MIPYSKYLNVIMESAVATCEDSMELAAQSLINTRKMNPAEVPVSIDGTWQKGYGYV